MPYCQKAKLELEDYPVTHANLAAFIALIDEGKVSNSIAYERILPVMAEGDQRPPLEIAKALNLIQSADEDFLEQLVMEVLEANPGKVETYRKGKKGLLGFFMGEVMKKSRGKAEPKATNKLLREKLG